MRIDLRTANRRRLIPYLIALSLLVGMGALAAAFGPSPDPLPRKDIDANETGILLERPDAAAPGEIDLGASEWPAAAPLAYWPPADPNPAIDVVHYELDLQFLLSPGLLSGTATLTLLWGSDPNAVLDLHLVGITPSAVRNGVGSPLPFAVDGSGLHITLPAQPAPGDTVRVAVDYSKVFGTNGLGFYVRPTASYTFTEPENSRYWFPCSDVPWDKATCRLRGKVPLGQTLVGNGALESTVTEADGVVYTWNETHPIATYLIAAAISNYTKITQASPVTSLAWYTYPSHSTASRNAFLHLDEMIAFYDSLLVPYPFDKYTMEEANFSGGMEHQSCTLMGEFIFNDTGRIYEWITSHELSHQWFGDLVTTADWRHIWLNEGFATFYDAVWFENFYGLTGPKGFAQRMQENENQVLAYQSSVDHPVVDPPTGFTFSTIIYRKGAWVLYMLRELVGRNTFNAAVRNYLNAHAFGNVTTDDFMNAVEAAYGQDLDWFANQWLYGLGRADLAYAWVSSPIPAGWRVQVDVRQVQSSPTIFRLPLEVKVTTTGGDVLATRWIEDAHEVVSVDVPDQPLGVVIDPSNKILGNVTAATAAAVTGTLPVATTLAAWPNPFSDRLYLAGGAGGPLPAGVRIFDVRGRLVRELGSLTAPGDELIWDATDGEGRRVPPGVYFARAANARDAVRVVSLRAGR